MSRTKVSVLMALLVLIAPTTMAQRRAPIHWVSGGETVYLEPGDTHEFEARFFSDVSIPGVAWWFTPSFKPLFGGAENLSRHFGAIEANRVYSIRVTLSVPTDLPPQLFTGKLHIHRHPSNPGFGSIPEVLSVKIHVMEPIE